MRSKIALVEAQPHAPLVTKLLRWRCYPERFSFESTEELKPIAGVIGQDMAVEALCFGLETIAPGQNIFVRGLTGTGRLTLIRRLLKEIEPACPLANDRCYVHNFVHPDRPRLITVDRGKGKVFAQRVDELIDFIRESLATLLNSDSVREKRSAIEQKEEGEIKNTVEPFEEELRANNLAMVSVSLNGSVRSVIVPSIKGEAISPEQFEQLCSDGKIKEEEATKIREAIKSFSKRLQEVMLKVQQIRRQHRDAFKGLHESEVRSILGEIALDIEKEFPGERVQNFLQEIIADVARHHLKEIGEEHDFTRLYRVNVILGHNKDEGCPLVIENTPTIQNLLGTVDREFQPSGPGYSDHLMIRAGSLLRADGGYLIIEAHDILSEPGAWKALVRTLRTGRLEIVPPEFSFPWLGATIKPEPIEIKIKVILIGDAGIYYALDSYDHEFPHLFKVLADFDNEIERTEWAIEMYARVLGRIAREENLPHFDRTAVAALAEHGARIAARQNRLTARFGRLADIGREAAFIATAEQRKLVTAGDVHKAVSRSKRRADLPARRFRELVRNGIICIQTSGAVVGQVNGLAVIHAGPLTYGFPARITATVGPGTAGAINIEREANLSGSIHTKGFYILGGLLRYLLRTDHPPAFEASVAFEQSYGGIDGDSASGAEMCCLLSALTDIPLRQDLAMTGAIDQVGHIQPVGAVAEKIEGFFDTCIDIGSTGTQGVIIPKPNVGELMLREDVIEASATGKFSIYAVETIAEAIEIFTGCAFGIWGEDGQYPEGTLMAEAVDRARKFWRMASPERDNTKSTN